MTHILRLLLLWMAAGGGAGLPVFNEINRFRADGTECQLVSVLLEVGIVHS